MATDIAYDGFSLSSNTNQVVVSTLEEEIRKSAKVNQPPLGLGGLLGKDDLGARVIKLRGDVYGSTRADYQSKSAALIEAFNRRGLRRFQVDDLREIDAVVSKGLKLQMKPGSNLMVSSWSVELIAPFPVYRNTTPTLTHVDIK